MVDDSMPHPSISVNSQELNSVWKIDKQMDVEQPKGDFTEDLYESECHNKYIDSKTNEVNNDFIMTGSAYQDCLPEVNEMHIDAGFDDLVEPSAMCLSKTRADEDITIQFSDDANLSEHEHSALQECCRETETDGNGIKDICIDEGLPVKERIHVEDTSKDLKNIVDENPVKDEKFDLENEKVDGDRPNPMGLKSSTDLAYDKDFKSCEPKVLVHQNGLENEMKKLVLRDLLKEEVAETLITQNPAADDLQLKIPVGDGCKDEPDTAHNDTSTKSEVATGKLRSSSSTPEETARDCNMEATNKSSHPTAVNNPKQPDGSHLPQRLDPFILSSAPPLQRDHFESSFASVGHYNGSITYSGPIPHSGSLSHRSDASTASTRSFAFPVLQNEWNFSPIRMHKADRRHMRRHRRWMHGLFCCKF